MNKRKIQIILDQQRTAKKFNFFTEQPEITSHPQGVTIREGQNMINLSCNATGSPLLTISWTRNGISVNASGNSRISFSADKKQLTITNVSRTDNGEYRCVTSNRVGSDISNAATVNVQCKYGMLFYVIETKPLDSLAVISRP